LLRASHTVTGFQRDGWGLDSYHDIVGLVHRGFRGIALTLILDPSGVRASNGKGRAMAMADRLMVMELRPSPSAPKHETSAIFQPEHDISETHLSPSGTSIVPGHRRKTTGNPLIPAYGPKREHLRHVRQSALGGNKGDDRTTRRVQQLFFRIGLGGLGLTGLL